jgi:hypothetical protein
MIHFMRKHCSEELSRFSTGLTCPTCQKDCNSHTAFLYHVAVNCIQLPEAKQTLLNAL